MQRHGLNSEYCAYELHRSAGVRVEETVRMTIESSHVLNRVADFPLSLPDLKI